MLAVSLRRHRRGLVPTPLSWPVAVPVLLIVAVLAWVPIVMLVWLLWGML